MKRPQHRTTKQQTTEAKADDLTATIKALRMAVNAGNVSRAMTLCDDITSSCATHNGEAAVESCELALYTKERIKFGITEPARHCLNALVGALETMAEKI